MKYNTEREHLVIPEYGRSIQKYIQKINVIEDPEERQAYAEEIAVLMQRINPQGRNAEEYSAKIWSHMFQIGNYQLNVEPPCPIPTEEEIRQKPAKVAYPGNIRGRRHYGVNIQKMIDVAVGMEDEEQKMEYAVHIASYMKLAFRAWNQEHPADGRIKDDLRSMSENKLDLGADVNIDSLYSSVSHTKSNDSSSKKRYSKGKNNKKGGKGKNNNYRKRNNKY